ncbi:DUF5602 domain-containing protein [Chitinophaga sedimenti]|uniref:DUF5602 domain-containing protein n=1 Tax=Chitinophaga sedimenti TaxID=2033606 RepID=UPI002004EDA8|nr:DUF5602 domain-containing protein [Chitinophaga sedimenti]MCK7558346.1 DUF5602 domain-containing protein [Chitinophaga sedimenti]
MKKIPAALVLLAAMFTSCDKDDSKGGTFKGPELQLHDGKARSWVKLDEKGNPLQIGVTITDAAFNSVPFPAGEMPGHNMANSLSLQLPKQASSMPFKHIGLDWNPAGHEPPGIYDKPHFDFHFYMISQAERMQIPTYDQDSLKFKNSPAPAYLPASYANFGGGVPQMGAHWVDLNTPEIKPPFNFTETFFYGSYNGKVIFLEPMITHDFIKNVNASFTRDIPQPAKFQVSGYYPTKSSVVRKNGVTEVILEGLVYKTAS